MTWFKVDDNFAFHQKTVAAGNAAVGMWVRAGSWCADQLTDGFVPDHMISSLGTAGQAKKLVSVGLWIRSDGGYQFHQWNDEGRQPTRAEVEAKRDAEAEKKRRWREARAAQRAAESTTLSPGDTPGDNQVDTPSDSLGTNASVPEVSPGVSRSSRPDPTRPDPDISKEMSSSSAGPRKRGHRLPDNFAPSEDLQAWARDRGFNDGQIAEMTDRFRDHWHSTPGAKGVKSNWDMAWRNWVGREDPARVRAVRATANGQRKWTNAELDAVLGADLWVQPQPPGHLDPDAKHVWWVAAINDHRAERIRQAEERSA